ncbi:MAG: hypothetical protein HC905_29015 [Bacteroidales bacterium]|nr:hypothetical protein [Bacteroidales bacterium]
MRYNILAAIVTLSLIFNFSNGQTDSITIKISCKNSLNTENLFFNNSSWFLVNKSIRFVNQPGNSFSKDFRLPSDSPMLFELYAHAVAKGLAFPGDTVYLSFNLDRELTSKISITGKTGSICGYYTNALNQCFSYNYSFPMLKPIIT